MHTRNIAEPDVGLKLTGKTDEHSYGFMVANDNQTSFLMPGNQGSDLATLTEYDEESDIDIDLKSKIAIARYKMDVGERNNIGILMTHRNAEDYDNTLLSVDGTYWFGQNDKVSYQVARSETANPESVATDFEVDEKQTDNAFSINYNHNTRDYSLRAAYNNIGEDFRADLGFQSRSNI